MTEKPELTLVGNVTELKPRSKPVSIPGISDAGEFSTEVVRLIACINCHSPAFNLAHDGRVICAVCKNEIAPLRWIIPDAKTPA